MQKLALARLFALLLLRGQTGTSRRPFGLGLKASPTLTRYTCRDPYGATLNIVYGRGPEGD